MSFQPAALWLLLLAVLLVAPRKVAALPGDDAAEPEDKRVAKALQAALELHGGDVNRCFERALADRIDVAGQVELAVDVGAEGKVTKAVPTEHERVSPILLACLTQSAETWTLMGIDEGSTVILPLLFEGQVSQFSLKASDAPVHGPRVSKSRGGKAGAPPFSVRLLVDEATMHARHASLSLVTVAPANRIAMHRHPGAEILYVLKGRLRILGPSGTPPETLTEGAAVFIPPAMPHALENMVRTASVEALEIFAPPGPERVYRDPGDAAGRAAFEVLRDPRKATLPSPDARLVAAAPDRVKPHVARRVKTWMLLDEQNTGSRDAALSLIALEPGAEIPPQTREGTSEIFYVLEGSGTLMVGREAVPFGPAQALYVPDGQAHSLKAGAERAMLVQILAPVLAPASAPARSPSP